MDIMMFVIPIALFLLFEIYCMKRILPQLENKYSFRYFDRTTWLCIIAITTIIGYLFYLYLENDGE